MLGFKKERVKNKTKKAMLNRRLNRGMADLLSYLMMIDDATILHKDGALSRHFVYLAPDLDSCTGDELDFFAETWQSSFSFLGNGFMVETNVISQPFNYYSSTQGFPELVSAVLDDERRIQYQDGQYFKTTYFLSITYKPESMIENKLRKFAIDGEEKTSEHDEELKKFNKKIDDFIGYLSRSLHHIRPVEGDELTSFLAFCVSQPKYGLKKPDIGAFLDNCIAEDFLGGFQPKIGEKFIKVLALDDLPSYSYPAILDELSYLPIDYRWSSRFICLDKITAKSYLKKYERNWSSKAIGVMGVLRESMGMAPKIDLDAQATADTLKMAQVDSSSGALDYGFYNSCLVLIHDDKTELDEVAQELVSKIQKLEFRVRIESVNAAEAYLGSLPCHGDYNLRKMLQDTRFLSHALPTSSLYQGEALSPCDKAGYKEQAPLLFTTTKGARPFMLNLHVGDVGHTCILGPTGMGKTTLTSMLACSHRKYQGSRIVVLDKDSSNENWILALGGQYIDPEKKSFKLSPLARVAVDNQPAVEKAIDWVVTICSVQGVVITPAKHQQIREAVDRLAREKKEYKNLDHLAIQDQEIRAAISAFNSGMAKEMLNGTEPSFNGCSVLGFEMSSLIKTGEEGSQFSIPTIKAVFNEIEEMFVDRQPTLLVLEEAWLYLKHPMFMEKLTDWFKTLRKMNVAVIFISQDLDDIVKSDASSVIQTSCMTRIFLPNSKANEKSIAEQYESFGLNEQQIAIIRNAIPKREYYYQSAKGNRLFNLDLGPLAQAFLCISEKEDIDLFQKLCLSNKPDWVSRWLRHKNLDEWSMYVEKNYSSETQEVCL